MSKKLFIEPKFQVMNLNLSENIAGSGTIETEGEITVVFETRVDGPPGALCTTFVVSWTENPSSDTSKEAVKRWLDMDCMSVHHNPKAALAETGNETMAGSGQISVSVPADLLY